MMSGFGVFAQSRSASLEHLHYVQCIVLLANVVQEDYIYLPTVSVALQVCRPQSYHEMMALVPACNQLHGGSIVPAPTHI